VLDNRRLAATGFFSFTVAMVVLHNLRQDMSSG